MNCVSFLSMLFYLFLNVFSIYSSEHISSFFRKQCNQLMNVETYKDNSGKFTLDRAEKLIAENENLINTPSSRSWGPESAIEWVCYKQVFEQFGEEGRLKIARFLLKKKNIDKKKLISAFHLCYALSSRQNPNNSVINSMPSWATKLYPSYGYDVPVSCEGKDMGVELAKISFQVKEKILAAKNKKILEEEEDLS